MNLNVQDNRPQKKLVKGHAILSVKPGTLVRYEAFEGDYSCDNKPGMMMIRTNSEDKPLVCLRTGQLWGTAIENDVFEILEDTTVNIDIKF